MGSKYAKLKKTVPEQPTAYNDSLRGKLAELGDKPLSELTALYNEQVAEITKLSEQLEDPSLIKSACEILIRKTLDAQDADAVTINGFTWGSKPEPYPVCEDPDAIVKFFIDNDMADQLKLTKTELGTRLKGFVKEEALNNELVIEVKQVLDPETGEMKEQTDVRSKIPGVRVFLKYGLTRAKSTKGAK